MKPNQIKARLILAGVTSRELARRLAVTDAAVSRVISGHMRSARIRAAVADAVGKQVAELWPDDGRLGNH